MMLRCLSDPFGCAISAIPGWAWVVLTGCALVIVVMAAFNASQIVKAIAGWPGVGAFLVAVATVFFVLWPKRKSFTDPLEQLAEDDQDAAPPVSRRRRKKAGGSLLGRSLWPRK